MQNIQRVLLGVNIDHIATIRQARGDTRYPDPVAAALLAEEAGADGITVHLREDRRHIQDRDIQILKKVLLTRMNLEMAATKEMVEIACNIRPAHCCIVPERREELTTEGGLDVFAQEKLIHEVCQQLIETGIQVSLFINADPNQINSAKRCGAQAIELHTGCYAQARNTEQARDELQRLKEAADYANKLGLIVNAGHGLNYQNVQPLAAIPQLNELNIGHSIIARALFTGIKEAVVEMRNLIFQANLSGTKII